MDLKVICQRCNKEIAHRCDLDVQEALLTLLRWVPEFRGEPAVIAAFKKSAFPPGPHDREMPFFGSQCWSYSILGKEDARSFHAYLHNLMTALGLDPHAIENQIALEREEELARRAELQRQAAARAQEREKLQRAKKSKTRRKS